MILGLYSWLMRCLQPLLRRKLARRGDQEPGYLLAVEERFGRYSDSPWPDDGKTIWLHAVSLGETRAAAELLSRLRSRLPGMRLLLTHGTATGRAEGARLVLASEAQVWQPWDTPDAVSRFLAHFRPRIGILLETEVWPNLAAQCASSGVPLLLANARLSEKSLKSALWLGCLAKPAYRSLHAVWAQNTDDAERLRALGAPVQGVFGNLKFDAQIDQDQLARGRAWRAAQSRPVMVFASSREGEEADFLRCLRARWDAAQSVQWLLVPRHPQRFEAVADAVQALGFTVSRRSEWDATGPQPADVWLGNTLGEMATYYGLSHAALLGGSFAPLGGQNLIEAAACACPILMGPHTFNFSEVAELAQQAGAALRLESLELALAEGLDLLADPSRCAKMAESASRFAQAHRGAADRTAAAIMEMLTWPTGC